MLPSPAPDAETPTTHLKGISVEGTDRLTNRTSGANPSGNRRLALCGQKGVSRSSRKCVNPLTEKSANVLVRRVYITDHGWLYQNPRFHPLPPVLKTRCFTPRKPRSGAVLEFTLSGTQRMPRASTA